MKTNRTNNRLAFALSAAAALTFTHGAFAQEKKEKAKDPGELALKYSDTLAANRAALGKYSWQLRVEVTKDGELEYVDLMKGRYTAAGALELTKIDQDLKIKKRHGAIRGNIQEKRLAKVEAAVDLVKKTMLAYMYMSRGDVVNYFDRATKLDAPRYENVVLVQGTNVLRKGDSVSLYIDKISGTPVKLWFSSPDETGANVVATVNFRHLRTDAIFVPDQADAVFRSGDDKGNLNIKVESFDFLKQL